MKKIMFILLLGVLLIGVAVAERYEDNLLKEGKIDSDGELVETSTPIEDVGILGLICSSLNCASVSGKLWPSILSTNTDFIQLVYPTKLLSNFGYGVYMFKEGYIPYEVNADWWGTSSSDPVGSYDNYLSKKEMCVSKVSDLDVSLSGGEVEIEVDVDSPIEHAGPLDYVPSEIEGHYEAEVNVNLQIRKDGSLYNTATKKVEIPFSGVENVGFSFLADPGKYQIDVYTSTDDEKCIDSGSDDVGDEFEICYEDSDCGDEVCFEEGNYCGDDGNVYHDYIVFNCENPGTLNGDCFEESITRMIGTCVYACEDGRCVSGD